MLEDKINWAPNLEAVAQAVTKSPEAIGLKHATDETSAIIYGTSQYYQAISSLVGISTFDKMCFRDRVLSFAFAATPLGRVFIKRPFERMLATKSSAQNQAVAQRYFALYSTTEDTLPSNISRLAQSQPEGSLKDNVMVVADKLKAGDRNLRLKLFLDNYRGIFTALGFENGQTLTLLNSFLVAKMPILEDYDPINLRPSVLETIDLYGLADYARVGNFFRDVPKARAAGEVYERMYILPGSIPLKEENSPLLLPYEKRLTRWQENHSVYEEQKKTVAGQLKRISQGEVPAEGLDLIIEFSLDHPMARRIMETIADANYSQGFLAFTFGGKIPDLPSLAYVIKTSYQYGRTHDSGFAKNLQEVAVKQYLTFISGLYNIA